MKRVGGAKAWTLILIPPLALFGGILILNSVLGLGEIDTAFKRFANAILTSYILAAGALFGAMFFYADSRNRPAAPLIGMLVATGLGALLMLGLLSQGDLLLEDNGSMQAQFLSNVVHLLVVSTAILSATGLVAGLAMSFITATPPKAIPWQEEE